ncbi:hypothetical protein [Hansschlegelia sp. KR7-227]|uniref:hypothetical protein n=1 Tax=Hansschlegelia sp. KR7-227 TaxID=3400914 RepID=UPI003BFD2386
MDERDKIIREDYPVEKLPEDLRAGLGAGTRVRVTVEAAAERIEQSDAARERKLRAWARINAKIDAARASPHFKPVSTEEAVARVRELRDEWDR